MERQMTKLYVIGEFSWLLAGLRPAPNELLEAEAWSLRREVECASFTDLPGLARRAATLADLICAATLEGGDAGQFCHYVASASALWEFLVSADLLS